MDTSIAPTVLLIAVIVALFLFGWRRQEQALAISTLLVSIGIFGTFLGIAYALFGFDSQALEESIPSLLSGMRIAFISSVAGIFFAVLLRARTILGESATSAEDAPVEALAQRIDAAMQSQAERHEEMMKQLATLRLALTSAQDSSVVTQLRNLREDLKRQALERDRRTGVARAEGAGE